MGSMYDVQVRGYYGRLFARNGGMVAAALLVAVGLALVGVVADALSRRNRELGVRLALGARPPDVLWAVGRDSVLAALLGLIAGVAGLVALHRWLESVFFGVMVQRLAPGLLSVEVLGLASVTLLAASLAGVYGAARRAPGIDLLDALRFD
jgi:ABC-type antimicrobial peptide transport system permease subunit